MIMIVELIVGLIVGMIVKMILILILIAELTVELIVELIMRVREFFSEGKSSAFLLRLPSLRLLRRKKRIF